MEGRKVRLTALSVGRVWREGWEGAMNGSDEMDCV